MSIIISTPNDSNIFAAPDFDEIFLFPCFATFTPAPATTNALAVEIFKVPFPSPPVPTISIVLSSEIIFLLCFLIAFVAPIISSTVSPLERIVDKMALSFISEKSPDII